MASLLDAAIRSTYRQQQPVSPMDQASVAATNAQVPFSEGANYSGGPLTRGFAAGARGVMSATRNYGGALAEAAGAPETAKSLYDAAAHDQAIGQAVAPYIGQVGQVHGLEDAAEYGLGQIGQGLPALAPALVGGGLARAAGAGPVGSFLGGAAPLYPTMAGSAIERMRADPATAALSPQERLAAASAEGGINSLVGEAVPYVMQGRALGQAGLAARASTRPLAHIAADTAAGAAGMGATNVAMGEVSRANQRRYDPNYQAGQDNDQRLEEFASGVPLGAALAVPHAVAAHTAGAGVNEVRGALQGAPKPAEAPPEKAFSPAEVMGHTGDKRDGTVNGFTGEPPSSPPTGGGEAKEMPSAPTKPSAVHDTLRAAAKDANDLATHGDTPNGDKTGAIFDRLQPLFDAHEIGDEGIDQLREYARKFDNQGVLSAEDRHGLADAVHDLYQREKASGTLGLAEASRSSEPTSTTISGDGPKSQSSDSGFKIARDALVSAHIERSLAERVANQMQIRQMIKPGATQYLHEFRKKLADIVAKDPSMAGKSIDEVRSTYQRVRDLLEAHVKDFERERTAAATRGREVVAENPDSMREAIHGATRDLLKETGVTVRKGLEAATKAVVDIVMSTAHGEKGHGKKVAQLAEWLDKHGEQGQAFIDHVVAAARASFNNDPAVLKRLEKLGGGKRVLDDHLDAFNAGLTEKRKPGQVLGVMRRFLSDLRDMRKHDMTDAEAKHRAGELRARAEQEPDFNKKVELQKEAMRLERLNEEGNAPMQAFTKKWAGQFKDNEAFHAALDSAVAWERGKQDAIPQDNPAGSGSAATRAALSDDPNHYEARQVGAEGGHDEEPLDGQRVARAADDLNDMSARDEENNGTQGNAEHTVVQYHGESTLRGLHDEDNISAPVTPRHSPDFPSGMGARLLAQMRAVWGDKRVAELSELGITPMQDWAKDMAERTPGRSAESFLHEAMEKLLEHDAKRLEKLNAMPASEEKAQAIKWIINRAKHAASVASSSNPGTHFFHETGPQRRYGYYKLEKATGANVEVTKAILRRFSPKVIDGEPVSDGTYAREVAAKEGSSVEDVMNSMVTVSTKTGDMSVDIARLMRDHLTRHQQGDTIGVEEREGAVEHGKSDDTHQVYTNKELTRAFLNTMSALHAGEGVTGVKIDPDVVIWRDPVTHEAKTLHEVSGIEKLRDDGTAIYAPRATTAEDLEKIITGQAKIVGEDEDGRSLIHDTRDRADRQATAAERKQAAPTRGMLLEERVANAQADAQKGLLRNFFPGRNLDLKGLLRHMMDLNGIDEHDMGRLPKPLAAELIRDGLKMIRQKMGDHALVHTDGGLAGEVKTPSKRGDVPLFGKDDPRNAWADAVAYTRKYGNEEYPVTLRELLTTDRMPDMPRHDVDSARLHEARQMMTKADNAKAAAAERRATGQLTNEDAGTHVHLDAEKAAALRKEARALRVEQADLEAKRGEGRLEAGDGDRLAEIVSRLKDATGKLRTTEMAKADAQAEKGAAQETNALRQNEDSHRALAHSDTENESYRVSAILREHADETGEVPLFDRSDVGGIESNRPSDAEQSKGSVALGERQRNALQEERAELADKSVRTKAEDMRMDYIDAALAHDQRILARENAQTPGLERATALSKAKQLSEISRQPQTDAERKAQTEAAAAAEGVGGQAGEVNPVRGKQVSDAKLVAQAKDPLAKREARIKYYQDQHNQRETARAEAELEQLRTKAQNKSDIDRVRQELEAEARLKYAKTSEKMGGNAADLSRDVPFSKSTGDGNFTHSDEASLKADLRKLVGDLADLNLTKDDIEGGAAGMWEAAKKMIHVSMYHPDQQGVLHHEAWHAVEDFLKKMGPKGQRVLDKIYKHVDSPLMRKRLEELYKNDEGAFDQIRSGDQRERAAYAFQAHMKGETLPMPHEAKGWFGKIKDFIMKAARALGLGNQGELTNNFFDYVKSGDFARDKDNPHAVERGLGESSLQKTISDIANGVAPLREAYTALMEHTGVRLQKHGIDEYNQIHDMYAGPSGKGGYSDQLGAARTRMGNMLSAAFVGGVRNEDAFNRFQDTFSNYLHKAKLTDDEIARVRSTTAYDVDAIYKNFTEFEHDLAQHGGVDEKEAREIAQHLLDHGHIERTKELFQGKPEIAKKWLDHDPQSSAARMVYNGTRMAERRRTFDEQNQHGEWITDGKLDRLQKEGDAKANADGRAMAKNFIDSYEGRVGHGTLSPAAEAVMGVILTLNNVRLLPLSLFSQSIEPAQLAFRKNDTNAAWDALARGVKDLPRTFETLDKAYTKDYYERLAEDLGTVASSAMGGMVAGLHNQGIQIRGVAAKVNDAFFKYNGMDQWNRSMHIAATKMGVEFIKDHAAGISEKHSERFLKELGLKASDVQLDEQGNLKLTDEIGRALVQYVNESMAHPDAGSNPLWMNDPRYALLAQMKKFNWAHARHVLKRAGNEWKHGNFNILGPAALAVGFTSSADWLRHAVDPTSHGSMEDNMGMYDYVESKLKRAGMFGRQALFMDIKQQVEMGGTGLEPILGPTADLFSRVAKGTKNHNLIESLIGNAPGAHLAVMAD